LKVLLDLELPRYMAQGLDTLLRRECDAEIASIRDVFPNKHTMQIWPELGRDGWVLLKSDPTFRQVHQKMVALSRYNIRAILFTENIANNPVHQQAAVLLGRWSEITVSLSRYPICVVEGGRRIKISPMPYSVPAQ
jgi:hypothetical protein